MPSFPEQISSVLSSAKETRGTQHTPSLLCWGPRLNKGASQNITSTARITNVTQDEVFPHENMLCFTTGDKYLCSRHWLLRNHHLIRSQAWKLLFMSNIFIKLSSLYQVQIMNFRACPYRCQMSSYVYLLHSAFPIGIMFTATLICFTF